MEKDLKGLIMKRFIDSQKNKGGRHVYDTDSDTLFVFGASIFFGNMEFLPAKIIIMEGQCINFTKPTKLPQVIEKSGADWLCRGAVIIKDAGDLSNYNLHGWDLDILDIQGASGLPHGFKTNTLYLNYCPKLTTIPQDITVTDRLSLTETRVDIIPELSPKPTQLEVCYTFPTKVPNGYYPVGSSVERSFLSRERLLSLPYSRRWHGTEESYIDTILKYEKDPDIIHKLFT